MNPSVSKSFPLFLGSFFKNFSSLNFPAVCCFFLLPFSQHLVVFFNNFCQLLPVQSISLQSFLMTSCVATLLSSQSSSLSCWPISCRVMHIGHCSGEHSARTSIASKAGRRCR